MVWGTPATVSGYARPGLEAERERAREQIRERAERRAVERVRAVVAAEAAHPDPAAADRGERQAVHVPQDDPVRAADRAELDVEAAEVGARVGEVLALVGALDQRPGAVVEVRIREPHPPVVEAADHRPRAVEHDLPRPAVPD